MPIGTPTGYLDITNATLRGSQIVTTGYVGIANANPVNHLSVGSNLHINDTHSNILQISGNINAAGVVLGGISIAPTFDLEIVTNTGNTTPYTVEFNNTATAFVTTANATIGDTLTASKLVGDGSAISEIQSSNVSDFASNVTRIGILETDLGSNVTRIETLETDFGSNVTRVETLETDLGSNVSRIGTLETDLGSNVTRIETLETDLGSNVTRITNLESGDLTIDGEKTFSSNLEVGTTNLFVDTVTGKVGVGLTNPTTKLDIGFDQDTSTLQFTNSTRNIYRQPASEDYAAYFTSLETRIARYADKQVAFSGSGIQGDQTHRITFGYSDSYIEYTGYGTENARYPNYHEMHFDVMNGVNSDEATLSRVMVLRGDGKVGIGTTSPSTQLEVNGDIGIGRVAGGYTFREVPGGDIRAGIHSDSTNHLLFKVDNNDTVLIIDATGTAGTRLRMNRASNGAQAYTIASGDAINSSVGLSSELGIHCGSGGGTIGFYGNYSSIGNKRHAYFKNGSLFIEYSAYNNDPNVNFTGQHRTWVKDASSVDVAKLYEGMIVSSCHDEYIRMDGGVAVGIDAITINECLPLVSLSNVAYDKRCFGVLSSSEDPEKRESTYGNLIQKLIKEEGDTRVFINSLGEGAIWVVNTAGSLESGDYITTSNVSGYGQRQSDDILHNYTVGKITMNCDFNPSIRPKKQIKKELKDVTYYYSWNSIDEEIYNVMVENGETNKKIETDENGVNIYYRRDETKEYREDWDIEVRQELVNVLDEHGQLQWEDDPSGATEPAYKIRYLDASGQQTDEANAVHIAAFVGCTYHCG